MNHKRTTLHALSLALAAAIALPAAHAVERDTYLRVNTANLQTSERYQRLVVKYKAGTPLRNDQARRVSSLNAAAAKALPGSAPRIAQGRRLSVGADVITLSRELDHVAAAALMRQIALDPNVEYVEPEVWMKPLATPTDPRWDEQWHLKAPADNVAGINLPDALDRSTGEGVVVAVLDTGVVRHPDLEANVLYDEGYDFLSDATNSGRATDGRIPGGYDPGDWEVPACGRGRTGTSSWHGTHVAGTIAAVTNNATGVAGVAPEAVVLPVRVLGHCGGGSADISEAIEWAAGAPVAGVPAHGLPVEVINMSLGSTAPVTCPNVYRDALATARRNNVTVVVAAGNDSLDVSKANGVGFTMGNCSDDIVVVGAVGPQGHRMGVIELEDRSTISLHSVLGAGSAWGQRIDVAAPGGDLSTALIGASAATLRQVFPGINIDAVPDDATLEARQVLSAVDTGERTPAGPGYAFYPGTSMAAPHVAGIVALMQAAAPARLTPPQVKQLLMGSVRPFPQATDFPLGTGIVDATLAVNAAAAGACATDAADCTRGAIPLAAGRAFELRYGAVGEQTLYKVVVPAGARSLSVTTSGGAGDVDLLVSRERAPTLAASDASSARKGNNEVVRVNRPQAGTWYIKLVGQRDYSGVRVEAKVD